MEWIDTGSWITGETGGYLRICTEGRATGSRLIEALGYVDRNGINMPD